MMWIIPVGGGGAAGVRDWLDFQAEPCSRYWRTIMNRDALIRSQEFIGSPNLFHLFGLRGDEHYCHFPICQKLAKDGKCVLVVSGDQSSFHQIIFSAFPWENDGRLSSWQNHARRRNCIWWHLVVCLKLRESTRFCFLTENNVFVLDS